MDAARRIALLAAVVVVAVVLFVVLKPDDEDNGGSDTGGTTAAQQQQTTTTGGKKGAKPSPPPVANVRVRGGQPVGGVQDLEFGKGQLVQFVVTSDVADHVHVHGYDIMREVAPGKPARFKFRGDDDGQFEVELEDRGEQIANLKVTP